jgi:hypothetical protein
MIRATTLAALLAALAAPLACSGPQGGVPDQSSATDFNYITDDQLESAMWQLAAGVRSLQAILGSTGPVTGSQRLEVIRILDQMLVAADGLGPDGVATNHPTIERGLGRFREKLEIARRSVATEPPRYYLVGNISGTCLACHSSE